GAGRAGPLVARAPPAAPRAAPATPRRHRARRDRQRLRPRHLPPRQAAHVLRALRQDVPLRRVAPLGPEVLRGAARRERLEEEEGRDRGAHRERHGEHGEADLARRVAGVLLVRAGARVAREPGEPNSELHSPRQHVLRLSPEKKKNKTIHKTTLDQVYTKNM